VIAGNHHRADTGALRPRDRRPRFVARRIDHADETTEHEIPLDLVADLIGCDLRDGGHAERDAERAQGASRERIVGLENLAGPIVGQRALLLTDELVCASGQQDVRRTLGEHLHAPVGFRIGVDGAHQLALG
jgi:hypothetical protein